MCSTSSRTPIWANDGDWNLHDAALHGSSHYDLPAFLRWFTCNIGVHHVHHLCSRIPYYRLPRVLEDHPELRNVGRLTLLAELPLRESGAVGRDGTPPGLVPRGPGVALKRGTGSAAQSQLFSRLVAAGSPGRSARLSSKCRRAVFVS